ncbi:MAG: hypothetical protein ACPG5B_11390 [Chitinophagales bacterium]
MHNDTMHGDEGRYMQFAENLCHGFYSSPPPDINLWNGPAYPIFLMPFVLLKLPLICITLTNAVLQYLSIVFLFKTLLNYVKRNVALFFSFFWACYYIAYPEIPLILTECFTSFLIVLFLYFLSLSFKKIDKNNFHLYAGFIFGILVLAKIIFGYVLLLMLVLASLSYFIWRSEKTKKASLIFLVAFLLNIPYLLYTYSLTNKIFYWGNSGGMSLYWMSTPHEGEFGDWNNPTFTANCGHAADVPCNADLLAKNHQKNMAYVHQFVGVERDNLYKKLAFENIKKHPKKYIENCISNLGRLFFGVPTSYFYQRNATLKRFPPNAILLTFLFFCIIPTLLNFKNNIPIELKMVLGIAFSYLFLSMLVSAYPRQLTVIVPILLFWFAFVMEKCVSFQILIEND